MRKKWKWLMIPILGVIFWLALPSDDADYIRKVEAEIEERKDYLKTNSESPFRQFDIPYSAPVYFPIDSKYKVNAKVERIQKKSVVKIPDSQSKEQSYQRYAWLHFRLGGQAFKLLVLRPYGMPGADIFFLAFSDETSGELTYGGGRYMDIEIGKSDKIVLDFNLAYSPYCAYVDEYVCPFPPKENHLGLAVLAGEKYVYDH